MANITLGGTPVQTSGSLPQTGSKAPNFSLVKSDFSKVTLNDFSGSRLILNVFPSIDTGVCSKSVHKFNELASELENTKVLCISKDLPFAHKRFCSGEGIENVITLSDFIDGSFCRDYGLLMLDGGLHNLASRAIIVLDENGTVVYTEQVPEIAQEPNYDAALGSLQTA